MANFSNPTFDTNLTGWKAGKAPNDIATPAAWYDASQETFNDNDAVGTFTDRSGNSRNLTQSTTANKPIFKTNILNGNPVLRFNGTSHEMATSSFTLTDPVTAFSVHVWRSYINTYPSILDGLTPNTLNYVYGGGVMTPYSGGFWAVNHGSSLDTPLFSTLKLNGASSELFANGASMGTTSASAALGGIQLSHAYGGQWSNADQAEVIFYASAISTENIAMISSYLSLKYAITNAGGGLQVTRDTTTKYSGAASGKLVATTYNTPFYELFTPTTGSKIITCYAYTSGAAVTSADLEIYYDGVAATTSFTDQGAGWYLLSATVDGAATDKKSGVIVKASKTVYVDSFNIAAASSSYPLPCHFNT